MIENRDKQPAAPRYEVGILTSWHAPSRKIHTATHDRLGLQNLDVKVLARFQLTLIGSTQSAPALTYPLRDAILVDS
jgi:hypothetical protein